jgi:uncharacterized protein involved in exopolysaccharide biosynthesis
MKRMPEQVDEIGNHPQTVKSEDYISMRDLFAPLFRRRRVLALVFIGVSVGLLLLAATIGPAYTSHMAILVNRERLDPLVTSESTSQLMTTSEPVTEQEINSEAELLKSRDVLRQVVLANGLDKPKAGFSLLALISPAPSEESRIEKAVKSLAKGLKVEVTLKSNVIEASYSSSDPQRSYGVLKSLGELYTAKHVAVHHPAGSYDFFARETETYRNKLDSAESKLRNFGLVNDIAAPDVQRTNLAQQFAESVGLLHAAQQLIATDEERIRSDREQMNGTPQRSVTAQSSAAADKLLDDLNASLVTAEAKRAQLAMKYDSHYPLVQEQDKEIALINDHIKRAEMTRYLTETSDRDPTFELLREDLAKTRSDLAGQRANLQATARSIKSLQSEMVDLDQQSIAQHDLVREAKADEDNYLLYLSKREQERTADALDNTRIANVAIAVPPALPVLPTFGWPFIVLVALLLAAVIAISATYALDYLDPSFRTPAEVIDILGIPVVVSVAKRSA